jgi:prophage regulatory protein
MGSQKLERIPAAGARMGVSSSQVYREIKAGRLGPLVKLGVRASAVPAESVDAWIAARIEESKRVAA